MLGKVSGKSSRSSSKTCLTKPTGVAEKLVVNIKSQRVTHEILSSYLARLVEIACGKQARPTQYAITTKCSHTPVEHK